MGTVRPSLYSMQQGEQPKQEGIHISSATPLFSRQLGEAGPTTAERSPSANLSAAQLSTVSARSW